MGQEVGIFMEMSSSWPVLSLKMLKTCFIATRKYYLSNNQLNKLKLKIGNLVLKFFSWRRGNAAVREIENVAR